MIAKIITVQEAAVRLNLSETTVKRYLSRGTLKGFKEKQRWLISEESIQEFSEKQPPSPAPAPREVEVLESEKRPVSSELSGKPEIPCVMCGSEDWCDCEWDCTLEDHDPEFQDWVHSLEREGR